MGIVGIDLEREQERATLVHTLTECKNMQHREGSVVIRTLIGGDGEGEVEEIGGIWKVSHHC